MEFLINLLLALGICLISILILLLLIYAILNVGVAVIEKFNDIRDYWS